MAKKKKRGYGRKFVGTCIVVGCIAAILWGIGEFGFGGGGLLPWGQGDGSAVVGQNENGQPASGAPANGNADEIAYGEPTDADDSAPVLVIRVVRDRVYHGEQEIDMDGLMTALDLYNQPGYVWELHDDQAIVETYDNVRAVMLENGIEFVEW